MGSSFIKWRLFSRPAAALAFGALASCTPPSGGPSPAHGTADGSGGGLRKSTFTQINDVLFHPDGDDLTLKRRLRVMFHRLVFLRQKPVRNEFVRLNPMNNEDELVHAYLTRYLGGLDQPADPPAWAVLDRIFAGPTPLQEDLEALSLHPQDPPCHSDDGRETIMAINRHDICASREMLSLIAPEALLTQTLAVGAHEVAHLRGFKSEREPEILRDYVLANDSFLMKGSPLSDLAQVEGALSRSLIEPSIRQFNDPVLAKEERCLALVDAAERLGALPGALIRNEIGSSLQQTIALRCMGIDQSALPRRAIARPTHAKADVLAIRDATLAMIAALEKRRRQFRSILSPFFSWRLEGLPWMTSDAVLLANAAGPLLRDDGIWAPSLDSAAGARLRERVRCAVGGVAVSFSRDQCPAPGQWESYPLTVRDYSFAGKTCALARKSGHAILIVNGPHTIDRDVDVHPPSQIRDFELPDFVNIQILLNPQRANEGLRSGGWRRGFAEGAFTPRIAGAGLATAANNVALVREENDFASPEDDPMSQTWIAAVLHPQTASRIDFRLSLPAGYDLLWEKVLYDERTSVDVHCSIE